MAYLTLDKMWLKALSKVIQWLILGKPLRSIPKLSLRKSKPKQSFHSFVTTLYSLKRKLKKIKSHQSAFLSVPNIWHFSSLLFICHLVKLCEGNKCTVSRHKPVADEHNLHNKRNAARFPKPRLTCKNWGRRQRQHCPIRQTTIKERLQTMKIYKEDWIKPKLHLKMTKQTFTKE